MAAQSPGIVCTLIEQSTQEPSAPFWTSSCPYTVPLEMQHRKQSFYMHAVYCGKAHRQSASGRCRAVLRLRASHIPAGAGDPKRFLVHSSKHATHVPDSSDHMLRVLERGPGLQSAPVST